MVVGLLAAVFFVLLAELITHKMYPPPPGYDMQDREQMKKFVSSLPTPAFVLVLTGWLVGTLAGVFAAARIGRTRVSGYVVGAILLLAGIVNAFAVPQPVWFSVASIVIFVAMTIAGTKLGRGAAASQAAGGLESPPLH